MKNIIGLLNFFFAFCILPGCEKQQQYSPQATEIFPPHELFTVALYRMNNLNIAPAYFKNNWTSVVLGHAPCTETCLAKLAYLNTVSTGQKLFVFDNLASNKHIKELSAKFNSVAITMGVSVSSIDYFLAHFDIEGIEKKHKNNYFYIVNPGGAVAYSLPINNLNPDDMNNELNYLIEQL